jgi:hypothetical protein
MYRASITFQIFVNTQRSTSQTKIWPQEIIIIIIIIIIKLNSLYIMRFS